MSQTAQQPPAPQEKPKGGCIKVLGAIFAVLFGILLLIIKCDKSVASQDPVVSPSTTATAAAPSPLPQVSAGADGRDAGPPSAFDALWASASDPDPAQNYSALFSLSMSKEDFCEKYRCGDEFTRDTGWRAARDRAKTLQATTWREQIPLAQSGLFGGKPGFEIGEFVPSRNEFPVTLSWPRDLGGKDPKETYASGRTSCAPSRPAVSRMSVTAGGEAANLWQDFKATLFPVRFPDADAARSWKTNPQNPSMLRLVYRITSAAIDSHKETSSGVTIDSGAGGLALIKIEGVELNDRGLVLASKPAGTAKP